MNPTSVLWLLVAYFSLLLLINYYTSKRANNATFFSANRSSTWYTVAFGMIGASLSGVTFISIPGWVGASSFGYMQMVLGYLVGYSVIALVLLPLYYKLQLVSIYSYLSTRLGFWSYKTGAFFFLLSRTLGSALRLYLVASTLQLFLFDELGIPFAVNVLITIALIWLYTFRGGIKTIVYTDTLQTAFMLAAVVVTVFIISDKLGLSISEAFIAIQESKYSQWFFWETDLKYNFYKQFFGGIFIAITMTGLDQDMMQKNLTCRTLPDAQKNMFSFSIVLVFVNLLFLALGALLWLYADKTGLDLKGDQLYPFIAKNHLGAIGGTLFIIGVIAAAYSSADSALTALTTSFCIDFLDFDKSKNNESQQRKTRIAVHIGFSVLMFLIIIFFKLLDNKSIVEAVFAVASYTYGPLLGMFSFSILTPYKVKDKLVPIICIITPLLCFTLNSYSKDWLDGYTFGQELLIVNGSLTFIGLYLGKK
jgi:Na+/proline symporter